MAGSGERIVRVQQIGHHTARCILRGQTFQIAKGLRGGCGAQCPCLSSLTPKLVPLDEAEQRLRGRIGKPDHAPAEFAEISLDLVRVGLQAGIDLAAVPTGGTPAWLMRLQQHDIGPSLRQMKSGGEASDAAADDGNACTTFSCEPVEIQGRNRRVGIEARRQRLVGIGRHAGHIPVAGRA